MMKEEKLKHFKTHDQNTVVSFSGGRTSGFLLYHVLKAHDFSLPENVVVLFENTGKERVETLDFIHEVGWRWGVDITWLEWRHEKPRYKVVNFETASRNGEPFDELIAWKEFPPNPIARMCTQHLKVDCMRHYVREHLGWADWTSFIGIRADEPRRFKVEGVDPKFKKETREIPLRWAGVTEEQVLQFWREQPFDLNLKSYEGNCDLCYLKGHGKRMLIMEENPQLADWWVEKEKLTGLHFRKDGSYESLLDFTKRQTRLPLFDDPTDLGECLCHD